MLIEDVKRLYGTTRHDVNILESRVTRAAYMQVDETTSLSHGRSG